MSSATVKITHPDEETRRARQHAELVALLVNGERRIANNEAKIRERQEAIETIRREMVEWKAALEALAAAASAPTSVAPEKE